MTLMCTQELNPLQMNELDGLLAQCKHNDHHVIPVYPHLLSQRRNLPCNVLYYHQQQLLGFLSAFFFYDHGCELAVIVHPAFRRQGIAKQLMQTIAPVLLAKQLKFVVCSSVQGLNDAWLKNLGFIRKNSEFQMQWKGALPVPSLSPDLMIRQATVADITFLVEIDHQCFHTKKHTMIERFNQLFSNPAYRVFLIELNHKRIGKAHLQLKLNRMYLSDIAILPAFQRQGFGQLLIEHCILHTQTICALPLFLDVEADNQNALTLYKKIGFHAINACDFWRIGSSGLHELVNQ